jgi:hypothetical protein
MHTNQMVADFHLKSSSERLSMEDWLGCLLTDKLNNRLSDNIKNHLREFSYHFHWDQYFVLRCRRFPSDDQFILRIPNYEMFSGFCMQYHPLPSLVKRIKSVSDICAINDYNRDVLSDFASADEVLVLEPRVRVENLRLCESMD